MTVVFDELCDQYFETVRRKVRWSARQRLGEVDEDILANALTDGLIWCRERFDPDLSQSPGSFIVFCSNVCLQHTYWYFEQRYRYEAKRCTYLPWSALTGAIDKETENARPLRAEIGVIYDFTPKEEKKRDIAEDLVTISRLKDDSSAELLKACHRLLRDLPPRSTREKAAEVLVEVVGDLIRSPSPHDRRLVEVATIMLRCCKLGAKPTIRHIAEEMGLGRGWTGVLRRELFNKLAKKFDESVH